MFQRKFYCVRKKHALKTNNNNNNKFEEKKQSGTISILVLCIPNINIIDKMSCPGEILSILNIHIAIYLYIIQYVSCHIIHICDSVIRYVCCENCFISFFSLPLTFVLLFLLLLTYDRIYKSHIGFFVVYTIY